MADQEQEQAPPNRSEQRAWHDFLHRWHVAINKRIWPSLDVPYNEEAAASGRFMYDAKTAADEVPRLTYWFRLERLAQMPDLHRQCSRSAAEPIADNHLTCCLGVACRACPFLAAIDTAQLSGPEKDTAKAWTCVAHIISQGGDPANEGYVLTTGDRMFWDNLHASLAAGMEDDAQ